MLTTLHVGEAGTTTRHWGHRGALSPTHGQRAREGGRPRSPTMQVQGDGRDVGSLQTWLQELQESLILDGDPHILPVCE